MESLSKPPHRRKHSSVTNAFSTSFSMKNPYDNVLLSNGGKKTKAFGDGEYAEIFSGSSSIPVLDLSGLDERVGSGDRRSSGKLDYSNIFGGVRNDDVVLPYEELVNGSAKKTKQRFPADDRSPSQESGSLHSSAKTKRFSGEASDKSSDEAKQQFNISFNKTSQINKDLLNGKTHVAQLHAVPGFTYFVGGASQLQKKEDDKPVRSLKREVNRTWSFSAEVEAVKGKDGTNWDNKSRTPDKLHNVNEINLKSHPSKVLPPSKISSFVSKEDATEKLSGEYSPPLLDEEWDENSVAAVSAAALKKAIEQAQETINIAKMIMEGKKAGSQDGTKPKGQSKVKNTKKKMMNCGSEENKARENYERLDPIFPKFSGIDGKFAPKVEVERVWENVDAAKDLGETSIGVDKQFSQSCSETHYNAEKVELEKQGEKIGVRREATNITGLVASAEHKAVNLLSGLVDNIKNLILSRNKPGSSLEEMETGKKTSELGEVTLHDTKGPEIAAQLVEIDLRNPKRTQELEMSTTETLEQCQGTVDHSTGPENVIELVEEVSIDSRITQEQEKIVNEGGENLTKVREHEMIVDRELATDYKVKPDDKFQASGKMVNPAHVKVLDESRDQVDKELVEQEEMKKKSENVPDGKENGHELGNSGHEDCNGKRQTEDHQSVESDEQLNEVSKAEINERAPEVFPEISVVQTEVNVTNDLEMDDKKNSHVHDGDERNFSGEHDQIEATEMNSFEYKAAETIEMEAERTVEDQNKCEFQEATYEKDIDEADDPIFSETQEARVFYLNNKAGGYQTEFESYKDKVGVPRVAETSSNIDEDKDAEQLSDLGGIEIPGTDSLSKRGSEEDTVGGKFQNSDESDSSDGKQENFGVTDADIEKNLQKDEDTFKTSSEIHDDTKEYAAEIHWEISPVFCPDYETAEFSQSSESDKESESMFNLENIEELSANESREYEENAKNETSNKDEVNEDVEMTSKSNSVCSEQQSEEVRLEKSMETEKDTETSQNIEKNKENLTEISTMKEKDGEENAQEFDRDDHQKRIEAIKKGREREKDRIAVERAIREARERAFVEARERAERAAVERAAVEARQRAMAEAREKLDKASMEAKIRTERAAVERATTEARARALEKARSQKTSTDSKTQTEKYSTERFASSSRNDGLKHSFSSPDLEKLDGANSESAQRRKARLERHQRIMERASKALEEKNMRDLVAQKEQAERNRIAESLDADIMRWATGKEGNLRALLSTLQYILGADSGWQPISLTEIIATAAVKKAYRKATLYVHPDKLQQRGASIRQKYICEKVFDLLKAAWNRFNSEER